MKEMITKYEFLDILFFTRDLSLPKSDYTILFFFFSKNFNKNPLCYVMIQQTNDDVKIADNTCQCQSLTDWQIFSFPD